MLRARLRVQATRAMCEYSYGTVITGEHDETIDVLCEFGLMIRRSSSPGDTLLAVLLVFRRHHYCCPAPWGMSPYLISLYGVAHL